MQIARAVTITTLSLAMAIVSLASPFSIEAQPAARLYRIGVLEVVGTSANAANLGA